MYDAKKNTKENIDSLKIYSITERGYFCNSKSYNIITSYSSYASYVPIETIFGK
jgi:hypothetical protein